MALSSTRRTRSGVVICWARPVSPLFSADGESSVLSCCCFRCSTCDERRSEGDGFVSDCGDGRAGAWTAIWGDCASVPVAAVVAFTAGSVGSTAVKSLMLRWAR